MSGENGADDNYSDLESLVRASKKYQQEKDKLNGSVGRD